MELPSSSPASPSSFFLFSGPSPSFLFTLFPPSPSSAPSSTIHHPSFLFALFPISPSSSPSSPSSPIHHPSSLFIFLCIYSSVVPLTWSLVSPPHASTKCSLILSSSCPISWFLSPFPSTSLPSSYFVVPSSPLYSFPSPSRSDFHWCHHLSPSFLNRLSLPFPHHLQTLLCPLPLWKNKPPLLSNQFKKFSFLFHFFFLEPDQGQGF